MTFAIEKQWKTIQIAKTYSNLKQNFEKTSQMILLSQKLHEQTTELFMQPTCTYIVLCFTTQSSGGCRKKSSKRNCEDELSPYTTDVARFLNGLTRKHS